MFTPGRDFLFRRDKIKALGFFFNRNICDRNDLINSSPSQK